MFFIKQFWVFLTPILVAIHGCMSPNLKARSWMARRSSILFNPQLKHQQETNHTKTYKRARRLESSDQDQDPKLKKPKVANSELTLLPAPIYLLNQDTKADQKSSTISDEAIKSIKLPIEKNMFLYENETEFRKRRKTSLNKKTENNSDLLDPQNKPTKELFNRLPKTLFFKSLILEINNEPNTLFTQEIIEKLEALHRLKIPYTFFSSILRKCNRLHPCNALLNKILVKSNSGSYVIENKLEKALKNNITYSNISAILTNCSNKGIETYEAFINKVTEQKTLDQLNKLKIVGWTISNLSGMLHKSNNKALEAFERLINKLSEKETLSKLKILKEIGFSIPNLSSIVHAFGNKAPEVLQRLINTLTQTETLNKIQQLKKIGWKTENLANILSTAGKNGPERSSALINTLTQQETLSKTSELEKINCTPTSLSSMLSRYGKDSDKLSESFNYIIDLLHNKQYIETIKKVTTAVYSQANVIHEQDEILVSKKASAILKRLGDLRKKPAVTDPSNQEPFKSFIESCYNQNKHVDTNLFEVRKVSNIDPRIDLRGQDRLVAKTMIHKGAILGIYTGILLAEHHPIDHQIEAAYLATKNIYGLNKLNSYSFEINLDPVNPLYLSAIGRGNSLMKINAYTNYQNKESLTSYQPNVAPSLHSCDGKTPFILFYATEDIKPDAELLFDYGKEYWSNHDNNHDLANPDAGIYKELLNKNKYVNQAQNIRLLRLVREHDSHLYKNLLKHIKMPFNHFQGKDRLVECRKINNASNDPIQYRIYKLQGEADMGQKTKDYFEVKRNEVNNYNYSANSN